jgi:DNA-binding Xre family transcriptional regulator
LPLCGRFPTNNLHSLSTALFGSQDGRGDVCPKNAMTKRKDPPGYPGDEAVLKALGDALRDARIEKGPRLPRALGIVVRRLREKQNMSRAQLSTASGLSARFLSSLERGKASNATITQIVRLSFALNCPVTDLVNEIVAMEEKLRSE